MIYAACFAWVWGIPFGAFVLVGIRHDRDPQAAGAR